MGSLKLFEVMKKFNCKTIVFSSSATVYGNVKKKSPILESFPILPENTYGHTKATVESILQSVFKSSKNTWRIANLRYFNPIGAHKSALIGEAPNSIPNNIFPILCNVALRNIDQFSVYGDNWETKDGTCIRDYIHVMDLAESHTAALNYLLTNKPQCINLNIGTGIGTSVFELIRKFQNVVTGKIPYSISDRRQGDVPILVANNLKAIKNLNGIQKEI